MIIIKWRFVRAIPGAGGSVQAPSPPFVLGGLAGSSFGNGTAVLVGLHEESLAQLVLVQHTVGLLQNGARGQLFTGQNPRVLCTDH